MLVGKEKRQKEHGDDEEDVDPVFHTECICFLDRCADSCEGALQFIVFLLLLFHSVLVGRAGQPLP